MSHAEHRQRLQSHRGFTVIEVLIALGHSQVRSQSVAAEMQLRPATIKRRGSEESRSYRRRFALGVLGLIDPGFLIGLQVPSPG